MITVAYVLEYYRHPFALQSISSDVCCYYGLPVSQSTINVSIFTVTAML